MSEKQQMCWLTNCPREPPFEEELPFEGGAVDYPTVRAIPVSVEGGDLGPICSI